MSAYTQTNENMFMLVPAITKNHRRHIYWKNKHTLLPVSYCYCRYHLELVSSLYYYHWVDTLACGLLVPFDGIYRPGVSVSALSK